MLKKHMTILAVCLAIFVGATAAESAELLIQNGHRYTIHLSAKRLGQGDRHWWRGHRRYRELNRMLDLGRLHAGETKSFDLETGKWEVQAATRREGPRAEVTEVQMHQKRRLLIKFQ